MSKTAPTWRALIRLSFPMVIAQLAFASMGFVDAMLMGQLGVDVLAGGGLGTVIYQFCYIVGIGVLVATANFIAYAKGQNDAVAVHTAVLSGVIAVFVLCLVFGALIWQIEPLLVLFDQQPVTIQYATAYLDIVVWALLPAFGYILLRSLVLGLGKPGAILPISVIGAALNYPVSYVLMHGLFGLPALGIRGIALGTCLVSLIMFLGLAFLTFRQPIFQPFRFWRDWQHFSWRQLRETFGLGVPIAIAHAMEIGMFSVAALLIGMIGVDALAAHQVALQCATLSFMIPLGLSQAVSAQVGMAFGRRDFAELKRIGLAGCAMATVTASLTGLLFITFPEVLTDLFVDPAQGTDLAEVLVLAVSLLFVAALFQWVDAMQVVLMGILRGFKLGASPTLITIFSYWCVGVPFCYLLMRQHGAWGVWAGMGIGLAVSAVLLALLYWRTLNHWLHADRS